MDQTSAVLRPGGTQDFVRGLAKDGAEFTRVGCIVGLIINATYDQSITSASNASEIKAAIGTAIQFFENTISSNISVNIAFGYGEIGNGQATVGSDTLAESLPAGGGNVSFAALKTALTNSAVSADDRTALASLSSDPTNGGQFYVPGAEQKALGLAAVDGAAIDGYVGISNAFNFAWTPGARGSSGLYDAIGALEHEIAHVLGRDAGLQLDASNQYYALDLFRYTAPGQRELVDQKAAYFSINGGVTNLNPFDATGGDDGDWAQSVTHDSFGYGAPGEQELVTRTDLREMDILGYTLNLPTDTVAGLISAYNSAPSTAYAAISDTAADFSAKIDTLQGLARPAIGAIYKTTLTDSPNHFVHVTASQVSTDAAALATIGNNYGLSVSLSGSSLSETAGAHLQDVLFTGKGSVKFVGNGLSNEIIIDSSGSDTVQGGGGSDFLSYAGLATRGITAYFQSGDGTVGKGNSLGTDHVIGIRSIAGSAGNDLIHFIGNGAVYGGAGNDTIAALDTLSSDTNYLYGGSGQNSILTGLTGTHHEYGGSGSTIFHTGGGTSYISPGTGSATIVMAPASNIATSATVYVNGFVPGHDLISLAALGATSVNVGNRVTIMQTGQGAEISAIPDGKTDVIILEGVAASSLDLHGSDFILA